MRLLRVKETAKLLGVKPSSIRQLEKRGLLKAVRDWSGHRRFLEQEIVRYRRMLLKNSRMAGK
jgi:excisionase family DNA binding protein